MVTKRTGVRARRSPSPTNRGTLAPKKQTKDEAQWFASNPSKRWGELFFLYYSPIWMGFFGLVVVSEVYKSLGNVGYMSIGFIVSLPCILYPLLFPGEHDKKIHWTQRYVVKANIWIAVLSFVGNYFWTHYFYVVLGARYTFPTTIHLNHVPLYLYFITHAYFCSYHVFAVLILRRFRTSAMARNSAVVKFIGNVGLVFSMSLFVAFMETFTIASVPYYTFVVDRVLMYTIGSVFYGIYFYVSFPFFIRLDEDSADKWSLWRTTVDSLAACMLVTIILDIWRLCIGGIVPDMPQFVPFVYNP